MNNSLKIILSILGGLNAIFSVAIPTFISLLIVSVANLSKFNQWSILIIGMLSTLYRALHFYIDLLE